MVASLLYLTQPLPWAVGGGGGKREPLVTLVTTLFLQPPPLPGLSLPLRLPGCQPPPANHQEHPVSSGFHVRTSEGFGHNILSICCEQTDSGNTLKQRFTFAENKVQAQPGHP